MPQKFSYEKIKFNFSRSVQFMITVTALTLYFTCISLSPVHGQSIYQNDFETTIGNEWSITPIDTTPNGRVFLGQFSGDSVTLTLDSLIDHEIVLVEFDLYLINSWDGNVGGLSGPDIWTLEVDTGMTLLYTTFSNTAAAGHRQAYPEPYPNGDYPARTGASESNSLGYSNWGDTVYRLAFNFAHLNSTIQLHFMGAGNTSADDKEFWGVDNISVYLDTLLASVSNLPKQVPSKFHLLRNVPNPFNSSTRIEYEITKHSRVTLLVFNLLGEEIIRLVDREKSAGRHFALWNGSSKNGDSVASGVYIVHLQTSDIFRSKKILLLK